MGTTFERLVARRRYPAPDDQPPSGTWRWWSASDPALRSASDRPAALSSATAIATGKRAPESSSCTSQAAQGFVLPKLPRAQATGRESARSSPIQMECSAKRASFRSEKLIPISWTAKRQGKLPHKTIGRGGGFMSPAKAVAAAVDRYRADPLYLVQIVREAQASLGWVSRETQVEIALGSTFPSRESMRW